MVYQTSFLHLPDNIEVLGQSWAWKKIMDLGYVGMARCCAG